MSEAGLPVSKSISAWNKPLKADWKALFKALASGGKNLALGKWEELPGTGVEVLSSIGVHTSHGERAYLLIRRALTAAIHELVGESIAQFQRIEDDVETVVEGLDWSLEGSEFAIDRRFFDHPTRLSLLEPLKDRLSDLLVTLGLGESRARVASNRLGTYFTFHLAREWRETPTVYATLKEALEGPFATATAREQGWMLYNTWLQKRTEESVFGEAFSLKDIYIPLRAYWEKSSQPPGRSSATGAMAAGGGSSISQETEERRRVAVDLHKEIESWLGQPRASSASGIRLLSGGPGSGKSTFARMLSAKVSRVGDRKVLYVPLHQCDVAGDLVSAIGRFVDEDRFLTANPLDPKDGEDRIFLVLDGLDELEMQGKVGAEIAFDFVDEVRRTVERRNLQEADIRVLITGRPMATDPLQTQLRQPAQLLHALPYEVPKKDRDLYYNTRILDEDQRQSWWRRFQECTGLELEGLPEKLGRADLAEVTRQPLLNYLLALSYQRDNIDFSQETSLNQIYEDLLNAVYERQWESGTYRAVVGLEVQEFRRVLEEIAVAAWHGNGRTASMRDIHERFRRMSLERILERFAGDPEAGVGRLLLAFYFRRAGRTEGGDATFEFTHKSFGEYLVARRLVGMIETIGHRLSERASDFDAGWDESEALAKWSELAGPTALEDNLLAFLRREVALHPQIETVEWQQHLARLFSFALRSGIPMERVEPKMSYQRMATSARNAEATLLASLNACALKTEQLSKVEWPNLTSLGELLCRIRGQRSLPRSVALGCLSFLDATHCVLTFADLYAADFRFSHLTNCTLLYVILENADLRRSDLQQAMLAHAKLRLAGLRQANLQRASLWNADLRHADLEGADLRKADLIETDMREAALGGADLREADLRMADLRGADLRKADLRGADLQKANLRGADLRKADLRGADLQGVDLRMVNLKKTRLLRDQFEMLKLPPKIKKRVSQAVRLE